MGIYPQSRIRLAVVYITCITGECSFRTVEWRVNFHQPLLEIRSLPSHAPTWVLVLEGQLQCLRASCDFSLETFHDAFCSRVGIVDYKGNIVLDTFVSPTMEVTDYRTTTTGIEPGHLLACKSRKPLFRCSDILSE